MESRRHSIWCNGLMQESAIQKCYGSAGCNDELLGCGEVLYSTLKRSTVLAMCSLALWNIGVDMFITTLYWKSDALYWFCYSI